MTKVYSLSVLTIINLASRQNKIRQKTKKTVCLDERLFETKSFEKKKQCSIFLM